MTYSIDLINSALNYYKISNLGVRKVAKIFGISKSTLHNWNKNIPLVYNNDNFKNTIKPEYLNFVKNSLNQNPYQTQKDLLNKLIKKFNINENVSVSLIKKILKILNYTKKKAQRKIYNNNLKKHLMNKREFKKKIKNINKDDIICLDEVAIDRNTYKCSGYCHSSKRLKFYIDMKNLRFKKSLIVAIDINKVIKFEILENKNANTDIFLKFIEELTKKISNKYILMDNVNFHHNKKVIETIEKSNNKVLFIPPYSPEFNPIEKVFSVFKNYINKKVNCITKFKNLNYHILEFLKTANNFKNYYAFSFS
jgi:transposase